MFEIHEDHLGLTLPQCRSRLAKARMNWLDYNKKFHADGQDNRDPRIAELFKQEIAYWENMVDYKAGKQ